MTRRAPVLAAVALALTASFIVSGTADAECPHFEVPPATDAARSAREVFVGTVIGNGAGGVFDFTFRIDRVLRGHASVGDVRRFDHLYPGWPFAEVDGKPILTDSGQPFPPCEPIPGWTGNVIAFSLDALAPDGRTRYNAASWIAGGLPINRELPRTTLAEMERLSQLPATDGSPSQLPVTLSAVGIAAVGLAAFVVALAAVPRRSRTAG